jgi:hypothetical protein
LDAHPNMNRYWPCRCTSTSKFLCIQTTDLVL